MAAAPLRGQPWSQQEKRRATACAPQVIPQGFLDTKNAQASPKRNRLNTARFAGCEAHTLSMLTQTCAAGTVVRERGAAAQAGPRRNQSSSCTRPHPVPLQQLGAENLSQSPGGQHFISWALSHRPGALTAAAARPSPCPCPSSEGLQTAPVAPLPKPSEERAARSPGNPLLSRSSPVRTAPPQRTALPITGAPAPAPAANKQADRQTARLRDPTSLPSACAGRRAPRCRRSAARAVRTCAARAHAGKGRQPDAGQGRHMR